MSKSYDLSTSTKWANLADGDHVVKLRARGSGYGTSSFSNSVTVTKGSTMPVKGDLITIESKQYRVLKTNGSVAEVLAMYNSTDSQIFGSNNTYAGSALDTYCNSTFYGTLSSAMKNAIVEKTFAQDQWSITFGSSEGTGTAIYKCYGTGSSSSGQYSVGLVNAVYGASISRNCYVLSVQDVIDYLEATTSMTFSNTTLKSENIWKMFWNQTASSGYDKARLRSANSRASNYVFYINNTDGSIDSYIAGNERAVRPAFQIDLSKIEWTSVGGG